MGSNAPGESENARAKLIELLERLRLTWNDLPGLLATSDDATAPDGDDHNHQSPTWERATDVGEGGPRPEAGEIVGDVLAVLSRYVGLTDHESIAVALWIAQTWIFHQFLVTPRLALISPIRQCGKTTLLALLARICQKAERLDSLTQASTYGGHRLRRNRYAIGRRGRYVWPAEGSPTARHLQ
jgi:hypothetical protein